VPTLISDTREDILLDYVKPYYWSDSILTRYANESIIEACKRVNLIERDFSISVLSGTSEYALDAAINRILYAKLDASNDPLDQTTDTDLTLNVGKSWRISTGTPTHYLVNKRAITLYKQPIANDTLRITASIIPDGSFVMDDDIDSLFYEGLKYGIAARAFRRRNSDEDIRAEDSGKSLNYFALFDQVFGPAKSAKWLSVSKSTPDNMPMLGGRMC